MKRWVHVIILMILVMILPGCYDRVELEDLTLTLVLGIDLAKDNSLIVYSSSPVFTKEAKVKREAYGVKVTTMRQSRQRFDAMVTALTVGTKVQVVLVGKKVLEHEGWYPLLDAFYRNQKNSINTRLIAVDGPVAEIFNFYPK